MLIKIFLCFIFLSVSVPEESRAGDLARPRNFQTISRLNTQRPNAGSYYTEGYVVSRYHCEPCAAPSQCVPCLPDYVILSESPKPKFIGALTDKEVVLFVDGNTEMIMGVLYRVLVHILDVKTLDQAVNNMKVIYYEKVIK